MAAPTADLREWIALLEREGELRRVTTEVDPELEITEIVDRTVKATGPALLFERVKGSKQHGLPGFTVLHPGTRIVTVPGTGAAMTGPPQPPTQSTPPTERTAIVPSAFFESALERRPSPVM